MTDHTNKRAQRLDDLRLLGLPMLVDAANQVSERPLVAWLDAVRGPGQQQELAGLDRALDMFATEMDTPPLQGQRPIKSHEPGQHSRRHVGSRAARASAISVAGVVLFGGTAAAAFTGSLPPPLQNLAHTIPGVPAARTGKTNNPPATSTAPTSQGNSGSRGGPAATPTVRASAASNNTEVNPSRQPSQGGKQTSHPSPLNKPSGHTTGKPSTPPGKPNAHPTHKPSGPHGIP